MDEISNILKQYDVTHLMCDYYPSKLGRREGGTAYALIDLWRRDFPGIERAVVCTDMLPSRLKTPKKVDAVVLKTEPLRNVIDTLLGPKPLCSTDPVVA